MSYFDDLIPPPKPALNPTLDNPFEDPFADVVPPRSPDPWSMATSYDQPPYDVVEEDVNRTTVAHKEHVSPPSPAPRSNSPSSLSQENAAIGTPPHDRIVSPLQPLHPRESQTKLNLSFNGLALGGEVPGWGNAPSVSASSVDTSVPGRTSLTEDDDDDSQALARAQSLDVQSVAPVPDGGLSYGVPNTKPMFDIAVGDPQKVGDPISAHIVYTVSTQTSSSDFKKFTFSVLRRYSDFLWLHEALVSNNPGVVVPPLPEKVSFGRFEGSFVESRRLALNKCIQKIANHPRLCRDPDFKLFLESDSFALDIKHRKLDGSQGTGLMVTIGSSIAGPKFFETDEWFDKKKVYLDSLESQLKALVKSIEGVAKQRTEVITATMEFSEAIGALAASNLSRHLSNSLSVLAEAEKKAKEFQEIEAKDDTVTILGTVDEYIRLISSVRLTFSSRIKAFHVMKSSEAERNRVRGMHEKTLRQRGLDRQSMMPLHREIGAVEAKAQEARTEYEEVTKLIKAEVGRFELERIDDFKASLEAYLEGMIARQNEIIHPWEKYQQLLLNTGGMNPSSGTQSHQ